MEDESNFKEELDDILKGKDEDSDELEKFLDFMPHDFTKFESFGRDIQNRGRPKFFNPQTSPVYQAMLIDGEDDIKMALKILINRLGFKADSIIRKETEFNVTPAHIAVVKCKKAAFKAILLYNPDLNAEAYYEYWETNEKKIWEGTVKDFVEKQNDEEITKILQDHLQKLEAEEREMNSEPKTFEEAKAKLGKMDRMLANDFGISKVTIRNLEKKKAELENAEKVNRQIEEIKKSDEYRTEDELKSVMKQIAKITKRKLEYDLDNCPICMEIPGDQVKIISCQQCGGIFCEPCMANKKVAKCPLCQISLKTKPLVRCVFAEKCVKNYHANL